MKLRYLEAKTTSGIVLDYENETMDSISPWKKKTPLTTKKTRELTKVEWGGSNNLELQMNQTVVEEYHTI